MLESVQTEVDFMGSIWRVENAKYSAILSYLSHDAGECSLC